MKIIFIYIISILSLSAQHFQPLKMSRFKSKSTDTLSIFIKSEGKFYHVANFMQSTQLKITNNDTLLHRIQHFDAINTNLKFSYDVTLKFNLVPEKIVLNTDDSVETHVISNYEISTLTNYLKTNTNNKKRISINELIFEDNNIDVMLGQLVIKPQQSLTVPVFLTEDYRIEKAKIVFNGYFELSIQNRLFKAKQFKVSGSDFTQYYWLDLKTNSLLQYESVEDNIIMIKQNFNDKFK